MAISIGDALLKLGVDTRDLDRGMKGIGATIKKHQKAIGLGMVAAGGAILAGAAMSIKAFAQMGDEVQKMALRTGFSTEALSELRHAAEISGANLQTLEKGIKRMSMAILDANDGLAETKRAFDHIGIATEDLIDLTPEEQFFKIAEGISAIEDPTMRAALAQKILGRAGTALLPLFAAGAEGLAELRQEAHDLGIVFDQEAANKAAIFTDAMTRVKESVSGVKMVIAEQLIPVLLPMIQKFKDIVSGISAWMKAHPGLTRVIVIGTAALGALLIVLGSLMLLMPGLTAALAAFGITLHLAIWPITLVIAAIAALTAAGIALWKNWDKVAHFFKDMWSNIKIIFAQAVKWIVKTVLQPLLFYVDKIIGTIVGVLGKVVGFFNKEWGAAIEGVADKLHNLDDEIVSWADNLIESERAVKANRDAQRDLKKTTEEITEAITDQTDAWQRQTEIAETMTEATERQTDAIREQADALDEEVEARERVAEKVEDAIEDLKYERSEAGRYRLSIGDVIKALYSLDKTKSYITETLAALGDEQENVLKVLEAFNLEAEDVAKTLGMDLIPAVDGVRDSYKEAGEAAETAVDKIKRFTGFTPEGVAASWPVTGEEMAGQAGLWSEVLAARAAGNWGKAEALLPSVRAGMKELYGLQHGGIAMRPMTARIAERGPEAVIPLDKFGGYKTANIYFQMDGRTLVKVIGQPLVDEIRLRTGVRI